jgi:dihydroxy-acid dehydratase
VFETGGFPAQFHTTDICDGCAQGHNGMNFVLASREAICDMVEVHGRVVSWDGVLLSSSCDKSIPAHLMAAARLNLPTIFIPGGSMRPGPDMTTSLGTGDISLRQRKGRSPSRSCATTSAPAAPPPAPARFLERPAPCSAWQRRWAWRCPAARWCRPPCAI